MAVKRRKPRARRSPRPINPRSKRVVVAGFLSLLAALCAALPEAAAILAPMAGCRALSERPGGGEGTTRTEGASKAP